MLYKFILPTILCFSVAPLGFTYLMGFIDTNISDLSLILYVATYINLLCLVLTYQIKHHLYKLDVEIQEVMSQNEFIEYMNRLFILLFGIFDTLVLSSIINYNIDFNNTNNVLFCMYAFVCAFIIILDNTCRAYTMIKEKIY